MRTLAKQRREQASQEIGQTHIRQPVAWGLVGLFVLTLVTASLAQHLAFFVRSPGGVPEVYSLRNLLPRWAEVQAVRGIRGLLALLPSLREIREYEDSVEDTSVTSNWIMPQVQSALISSLGSGNEQVYPGKDGWLFYRADLDYLIGRGFLEPAHLADRRVGGDAWEPAPQPDPVRTILDFHRQLQERNITLVVMPTPVKPMVHPDRFSGRLGGKTASRQADLPSAIQNPSYRTFLAQLEAARVPVFDVSSTLVGLAQQTDQQQYLKTDTHWTPEAMTHTAIALANFLREKVELTGSGTVHYEKVSIDVECLGDIAAMLKLSEERPLFPKERVTLQTIQTTTGEDWKSQRQSEVLVLGDSFSNIYSLDEMGWGKSAGFVEHLSAQLGQPVDRIVMNAGGAYATRQALAQELRRGQDRLAGKRVVVYQFAMRELYSGDWKLFDLPKPDGTVSLPETVVSAERNDSIRIHGVLKDKSNPPQPGSVPYPDCLIALHVADIQAESGTAPMDEALVFIWGMRDNRWTEATSLSLGQQVNLSLRAWNDVEQEYGSYQRRELDSEESWFLDVYWGETLP